MDLGLKFYRAQQDHIASWQLVIIGFYFYLMCKTVWDPVSQSVDLGVDIWIYDWLNRLEDNQCQAPTNDKIALHRSLLYVIREIQQTDSWP